MPAQTLLQRMLHAQRSAVELATPVDFEVETVNLSQGKSYRLTFTLYPSGTVDISQTGTFKRGEPVQRIPVGVETILRNTTPRKALRYVAKTLQGWQVCFRSWNVRGF